jgi:hypothetical protein
MSKKPMIRPVFFEAFAGGCQFRNRVDDGNQYQRHDDQLQRLGKKGADNAYPLFNQCSRAGRSLRAENKLQHNAERRADHEGQPHTGRKAQFAAQHRQQAQKTGKHRQAKNYPPVC